jgi:hypothetical protein
MSRWIVFSLAIAMMLVVAACESDDATDDVDTTTDDTVELQTDDAADDTEATTPEDDDADLGAVTEDDDAAPTEDDSNDEVPAPADDAVPADDAIPGDDAVDPEIAQPGDQPGMFFGITFDEANDLTDFELREPAALPEDYELQSIVGVAAPDATPEEAENEATTVVMIYASLPDEDDDEDAAMTEQPHGTPIEFSQSSVAQGFDQIPEEIEQETLDIDGREVIRIIMPDMTGQEIVGYLWQDGDIYFSLATFLGQDLDDESLQQMIASIP